MPAFLAWPVIKALLGGVVQKLVRFLSVLIGQGVIGLIAACILAFLWIRAEGEARHWHKQSNQFEKHYNVEHSGRLTDRKNYQQAQADAKAKNKADVAAKEA